jgi:2,5-dihydroxypyridine 5,6-dioxygenase
MQATASTSGPQPHWPQGWPDGWQSAFESLLRRCAAEPGETLAVLCETATRPELPALARAAGERLGLKVFTLTLATPAAKAPVPIRSTGASVALQGNAAAVAALAASHIVLDCTVEGLMHAPELPAILKGDGTGNTTTQPRVVYVSHEHPETLVRCLPRDGDEALAKTHVKRLRAAKVMTVTSAAGTALQISLAGAAVGGNWGYTARPGTMTHWPGGLVLAFPAPGSVRGRLVLAEGDANLTFKRYLEKPVALTIEDDHITTIEGAGLDADLMRSTWAAWEAHEGHRGCYAVSHVGYGLNRAARWDSMAYFDKADFNGTELRAFAGNFLYSTGANEVAGRHTDGHFDLPLRGCTVALDGEVVVREGVLL